METHPPHRYARPIPDANPNTLRRRQSPRPGLPALNQAAGTADVSCWSS